MSEFKIAFKGLINNKRFSLLFIINLSIGLFGFIALDSLKRSFNQVLDQSSRNLLTADLVVSSRRDISQDESKIISSIITEKSRIQDNHRIYSMVRASSNDRSQLVEVKAIDESYPFYGELILKQQGSVKGDTPKSITNDTHAWLSPDLAASLEVTIGETIKLGDLNFYVTDIIKDDPSSSFF